MMLLKEVVTAEGKRMATGATGNFDPSRRGAEPDAFIGNPHVQQLRKVFGISFGKEDL